MQGQVHDYVASRTNTLAFLLGLGGHGLVSMISVRESQLQSHASDNMIHELAKTWRNNAASHSRSVETGREIDLRSRKLLAFLDSHQGHLDSDLDRVSRDLGLEVSGAYVARLFRRDLGIGVREYAKRRRMEVAATSLRSNALSVKQIAASVGYENPQDFSRAFRAMFKETPTEFRDQQQRLTHKPPEAEQLYHRQQSKV